jgi:5-methylthioribose kinase
VHSLQHQPVVELDPSSAREYIAVTCGLDPASLDVRELEGGVSNTVLLIEHPGERLVLKQSRPRLEVQEDWLSDRGRILREASALQVLSRHLPEGSIPRVLSVDSENYAYIMTAAPGGAETWKDRLLRGDRAQDVAERSGSILARIIKASQESQEIRSHFADLRIFDQLRLDPYYRTTASRNRDVAAYFQALVSEYQEHARCLVHGDWSPKNFLVSGKSDIMAIDFEAVHYGDPAFDAAFLLNHLLLKSFYMPEKAGNLGEAALRFWEALYDEAPPYAGFERMILTHLPALLLARIDGKSPAEYITEPDLKERIRQMAKGMMRKRPQSIAAVWELLRV